MEIIFNELSTSEPASSRFEAQRWMETLMHTISAVMDYGAEKVLYCQDFLATTLADGYSVNDWWYDAEVSEDLRTLFTVRYTWSPSVDELLAGDPQPGSPHEVTCDDVPGFGVHVALLRGHPVVSVDAPAWRRDPLPVVSSRVRTDGEEKEAREVCNLFDPSAVERRAPWLAALCGPRPVYENPGHHDPRSANFNSRKSPLPDDAEEVFRSPDLRLGPDGRTWWGSNRDGHIYRYQGYPRGARIVVHWSGSNADAAGQDRIRDEDIPQAIRDHFRRRADS